MGQLLNQLKADTRNLHDEVEQAMQSNRIMQPVYPLEEYVALLKKLRLAHAVLEPAILSFNEIEEHPELQAHYRLTKLDAINKDLQLLSVKPSLPQSEVLSLNNIAEAWGAMYVLEGSTLGGAMILKHLKATQKWNVEAFSYYGYYGPETGHMWQNFKNILEENMDPTRDYESLLKGASKAYHTFCNAAEQLEAAGY